MLSGPVQRLLDCHGDAYLACPGTYLHKYRDGGTYGSVGREGEVYLDNSADQAWSTTGVNHRGSFASNLDGYTK